MGLSTSRRTTKTNETQAQSQANSGTRMPIVPANLQSGLDAYLAQVGQLAGADPSSLVAGASPLQQAAFAAAANAGRGQDRYAEAAGIARGVAGAGGASLAGPAALADFRGYRAPDLAGARGYAAARAGAPQPAAAQGYAPTPFGGVAIAPIERAQASDGRAHDAEAQSLLTDLGRYVSPYAERVVDTTLAGFDDAAGRLRAQQAAEAARNGAFGGSRYALREARTEADLGRERAATEAALRDQAFRAAAGLSADDANRRQQASTFNAGNRTAVDVGNAERRTGVATFNAGQGNARALAQAGFDVQTGLFNADAATWAAEHLAGSRERTGLAQAELASRHALDLAGRSDAASRHRLDQDLEAAIARAGFEADAARFGADAGNQEAALNAAAANRRGEFDAGQRGGAQAMALQAAQLLGGLASDRAGNARADLQAQAALGEQQRGIEQAQRLSQLARLQALAQLYGLPVEALVGEAAAGTSSATSSAQGTSVTRSTPSLFDSFLSLGNMLNGFTLPGKGR